MKLRLRMLVLILIMLVNSLVVIACEDAYTFDVENQTDQVLTIYADGYQYSDVLPQDTAKVTATNTIHSPIFIEAKSKNGEIIYSKAFGWPPLDRFENHHKIIVTPIEESPYLPLEIENRTNYEIYIDTVAHIGILKPGESMKKRPLPSNLDTYTITASTYDIAQKSPDPKRTKAYDVIYQQSFTRAELERENWKIVITNPESISP
jgi:hypothetical protein